MMSSRFLATIRTAYSRSLPGIWAWTGGIQTHGPITQQEGERLVYGKWNEFRSARLVITDRLHGMIFSAVTGTPCVALNNSNGKVGYEYEWLKDVPYIAFASTVDEVPQLACQVLRVTNPRFPSDWFAEQFTPLTSLID